MFCLFSCGDAVSVKFCCGVFNVTWKESYAVETAGGSRNQNVCNLPNCCVLFARQLSSDGYLNGLLQQNAFAQWHIPSTT